MLLTGNPQKRSLTVLSISAQRVGDLSTKLSEEDIQNTLETYFITIENIVIKNKGWIYQSMDNQILAIFDVSEIYEKHYASAFLAAQEILRTLSPDFPLRYSIGIDSGDCLVSPGQVVDKRHGIITGAVLSSVSYISQNIEWYSLCVSESALDLLKNDFVFELGEKRKSYSGEKTKDFYYIRHASPEIKKGITQGLKFVGREESVALLNDIYKKVKFEKRTAWVEIVADAGMGKTRFVQQFIKTLPDKYLLIQHRFFPYSAASDKFLQKILASALKFAGLDIHNSRQFLEFVAFNFKISNIYERMALEEIILESVSDNHEEWHNSSYIFKLQIASRAVAKIITHISRSHMLHIIFEDIHWAGKEFESLMAELFQISDPHNLLVILTSRTPNILSDHSDFLYSIHLEDLNADHVYEIVQSYFSHTLDHKEIAYAIHEKSLGRPLLVEEIIRFLTAPSAREDISDKKNIINSYKDNMRAPIGLRGLVELRLKNLDISSHEVLFSMAAMGVHINKKIFEEIFPETKEQNDKIYKELCDSDFLKPLDLMAADHYIFVHDLLHNAIYDLIPVLKRKIIHKKIFMFFKKRSGDKKISNYELLARHAYGAREQGYAYFYNYRYMKQCIEQHNFRGMSEPLEICFECNREAKAHPQRKKIREAQLLIYKSRFWFMQANFKHMNAALLEYETLSKKQNLPDDVLRLYLKFKTTHDWLVADYESVLKTLSATKKGDRDYIGSIIKMGSIYSDMGQYEQSINLYKAAMDGMDKSNDEYGLGFPAYGLCLAMMARNYALLNNVKEARSYVQKALKTIHGQKFPAAKIFVLCFCSESLLQLKEYASALSLAEEAKNLSESYSVSVLLSYIYALTGCLKAHAGDESALNLSRKSIVIALKEGRKCRLSLYYYYLSKTFLLCGCAEDSLHTLRRALRMSRLYKEEGAEYRVVQQFINLKDDPRFRKKISAMRYGIFLNRQKELSRALGILVQPDSLAASSKESDELI